MMKKSVGISLLVYLDARSSQTICFHRDQIKPVEFLLGSTVRLGDIIVLGMLTQMKEASELFMLMSLQLWFEMTKQ